MIESPLLTRDEAASYLRRSLRTFERHVQPYVRMIPIGKALFTTKEELDRWLASQMESARTASIPIVASRSSTRASPVRASAKALASPMILSPQAQQMSELLKKPPRKGTPSLSQDASSTRARHAS